jgi:hypothetical protein
MASGSKIKNITRWRTAKATKASKRNPRITVLPGGQKIYRN